MPSAMENKGVPKEMSEANLLAPWLVTGKLKEEEGRELRALSARDPEFASLIEEMRCEANATVVANESLGGPPQTVWDRLEQSVLTEPQLRPRTRLSKRLVAAKASVASFLDGISKPQWQVAAVAAVAVCVVQGVAIVYLNSHQPTKYVAAGGSKVRALGPAAIRTKAPAFIVAFSANATIGQINAVLDDAGAVIVDGPNSDMLYHLGLRDDKILSKDQIYEKLRSSTVVSRILPEN